MIEWDLYAFKKRLSWKSNSKRLRKHFQRLAESQTKSIFDFLIKKQSREFFTPEKSKQLKETRSLKRRKWKTLIERMEFA